MHRSPAGTPLPRLPAGTPLPRLPAGTPLPRLPVGAPLPRLPAGALLLLLLASAASAATLQPPTGATGADGERFMVPQGLDRDGCPSFLPWSPGPGGDRSVHWRRADGTFTPRRAEAVCTEQPGTTRRAGF